MTDSRKKNLDYLTKISNISIYKSNEFNVEQLEVKIKKLFDLHFQLRESDISLNELVSILENIQKIS